MTNHDQHAYRSCGGSFNAAHVCDCGEILHFVQCVRVPITSLDCPGCLSELELTLDEIEGCRLW